MCATIPPVNVLTAISPVRGIAEPFHVKFQVTVHTYSQRHSWEGKYRENPPRKLILNRIDGVGWNPTSSSELAFRGRGDETWGGAKNRSELMTV